MRSRFMHRWTRQAWDDQGRQVSWLAARTPLLRLPGFAVSRVASGMWSRGSPLTVAGTAPDLTGFPLSLALRRGTVRDKG
jgi:hypothetical protein